MKNLPDGYRSRLGSGLDKALLINFLHRTYQELFPLQNDFSHLVQTVSNYFSGQTPIWWIEGEETLPVACLWMGQGIDQVSGDRYGHIFLIYVDPKHRRKGIATALVHQAQSWVIEKGQQQIGLQVFSHNQAALSLYEHLDFQTQSFLMMKQL